MTQSSAQVGAVLDGCVDQQWCAQVRCRVSALLIAWRSSFKGPPVQASSRQVTPSAACSATSQTLRAAQLLRRYMPSDMHHVLCTPCADIDI